MNSSYWLVSRTVAADVLRIQESAHAAWLDWAIPAMTAWLESANQCGRKFKKRTFTEEIVGDGENIILLENRPIVSITSFVDEDGATYTEANDDFRVIKKTAILKLGFTLTENILYTIIYEAGYDTIPEDVQLACVKLLGILHQTREEKTWDVKGRSSDAGTVTFKLNEIPKDVMSIIKSYSSRRVA